MRILILSFYYPPDIGPGPLRAKSLVDALIDVVDTQLHIDVMTTMPNRYHSLASSAPVTEQQGTVSIQRFSLPPHQSGMTDQARAFLSYARAVSKHSHGQQWDLVLATSSRLMTATLGAWIAKRCGAQLYLDIRDLFTDTMEDVLANSSLRFLMPAFRFLESRTFGSAGKINVVSSGFLPHLKNVVPTLEPTVFTNGIDDEFVTTDFSAPESSDLPLVLYAGNIGQGQGLHHIIPAAASALDGLANFTILGDGGERNTLQRLIHDKSLSNVQIIEPVPRDELYNHYQKAGILFLHLNDYKAFRKVLPSKIFEYAATGKPILAGVAGHAADFLREHVPGVEVFDPCDAEAMQVGLRRLLEGPNMIDRTEFCSSYLRKNIMRQMAQDVYSLAKTAQ